MKFVLKLIKPELEDMWFRQKMLNDEETMSYNHTYGGVIAFPQSRWKSWYEKWIQNEDSHFYYRYLYNEDLNVFVGEIAYHYVEEENKYLCDVLIDAKYRGQGYGKQGLKLLCEEAKKNGLSLLYDDILIDNPSIHLFLNYGFVEVERNETSIMVKKEL